MKKFIALLVLSLVPVLGLASEGGAHLQKANIDLKDQASLQRGARIFVNYCLSCHSAAFERYNRMGKDLGLTDEQVKQNLMFASTKIGSTMTIAMRKDDAETWFGKAPPDLSLVGRSRGADWLYTYLLSFYQDPSRPFGVNNLVFPDVGMPNILWKLQGKQVPVYKDVKEPGGNTARVVENLELAQPGTLSEEQYKGTVRDLVNFLEYLGEPVKLERQRLGVWVLLFLAVMFVVAYALKKEFWKDVH